MARTRLGPTPAELTLLSLLADGPAHPYALDIRLRESGPSTEVAFSSIYAALARLERLGLVSSRPDAGSRGRARRVYKLSPAGRTSLKASARVALASPLLGGLPNDLGIASLGLLPRAEALAAVAEARKSLADQRKSRAIDAEDESAPAYPAKAVQLHRSMMLAAEERFYAELEKLVQKEHPERQRRREDDAE